MHTRSVSPHALTVMATGLVLALGLLLVPGQARAQDMAMAAHPAHIHSGTCAELGDVVYPLTDVGSGAMGTPVAGEAATPATMDAMSSPMSGDTAMASPTAGEGATSVTTVEASLADLTAGGFAINVHESADNIGNYIACGDITGTPDANGDVTVELATLNDSGYSGTAKLHDNGDGTTAVTIDLMSHQM